MVGRPEAGEAATHHQHTAHRLPRSGSRGASGWLSEIQKRGASWGGSWATALIISLPPWLVALGLANKVPGQLWVGPTCPRTPGQDTVGFRCPPIHRRPRFRHTAAPGDSAPGQGQREPPGSPHPPGAPGLWLPPDALAGGPRAPQGAHPGGGRSCVKEMGNEQRETEPGN